MQRHTRMALLYAAIAGGVAADDAAEAVRTIDKGRVEFSTSASIEHLSDGEESLTTFNLPLRVGVFATPRLELEGELALAVIGGGRGETETAATFSGNVAYHLAPPGRTLVPFVLAGGGVGNAAELFGFIFDAEQTIKHVQAGLGLKAFVGSSAALRVEYRYRHVWGSGDGRFDSNTESDAHRVFVGIALFMR